MTERIATTKDLIWSGKGAYVTHPRWGPLNLTLVTVEHRSEPYFELNLSFNKPGWVNAMDWRWEPSDGKIAINTSAVIFGYTADGLLDYMDTAPLSNTRLYVGGHEVPFQEMVRTEGVPELDFIFTRVPPDVLCSCLDSGHKIIVHRAVAVPKTARNDPIGGQAEDEGDAEEKNPKRTRESRATSAEKGEEEQGRKRARQSKKSTRDSESAGPHGGQDPEGIARHTRASTRKRKDAAC